MNLWKILALIMIGLLIIAAGLRFAYMETHVFSLNEEEKTLAINAAQNGLKDEIGDGNFNVTVADKGWIISTSAGDKRVVPVVFTSKNITIAVLIDMDTGSLVEKRRVEYTGWMTEYQKSDRWAHKRLFGVT